MITIRPNYRMENGKLETYKSMCDNVILERLVALRDLLADTVRIWVKVVFLPDSTNFWFFPQIVHLASFGAQLFLATLAFRNRLWRVQAQLAHAGAS